MNKDRIEICKIISDMLDNPDKHGIYPTSTAYARLEHYIEGVREEAIGQNGCRCMGHGEGKYDGNRIDQ